MKRSEAVELLRSITRIYCEDELDSYDCADRCLQLMVNSGMLPPETEIGVKRDLGGGMIVTYMTKKRQWSSEEDDNKNT